MTIEIETALGRGGAVHVRQAKLSWLSWQKRKRSAIAAYSWAAANATNLRDRAYWETRIKDVRPASMRRIEKVVKG